MPPQAESVRSLVDRLASTRLDIVVNFQAGRSRSAAVARYISERHGYDLKQETPDANQTVLRLLRRDSLLCSTYREVTSPIGADVESGLVHHVQGTAANVADVTQVAELLHGEENAVYADAGYTGVEKRDEHENREVIWQIAARRSTYSRLNKRSRNPLADSLCLFLLTG